MRYQPSKLIHVAMSLLILSSGSGCSFIFVKTPANDGRVSSSLSGGDCTSSRLAPGFDSAFGALQLVRTSMAATARDSVYESPDAPLSREADIALGAGFMALFVGSAVYGFVNTSRCSRLKRGHDADLTSAPDPAETWGSSTPVSRPAASSGSSVPPVSDVPAPGQQPPPEAQPESEPSLSSPPPSEAP